MNLKYLYSVVSILIVSILQILFQLLEIKTTILIWEIIFDFLVIALILFSIKFIYTNLSFSDLLKEEFQFVKIKSGIKYLTFSILIILILIIIGFLFKEIKFQEDKNLATYILGLILDFPAILFFGIFTIFIEEFYFRKILFYDLKVFNLNRILSSVILFSIYKSCSEINIDTEFIFNLLNFFFYFSVGLASYSIFAKTKSLISSYLFRSGLIIFLPFFFNSFEEKEFSIFKSKSILFLENGIITSIIILFFAIFMLLKSKKENL